MAVTINCEQLQHPNDILCHYKVLTSFSGHFLSFHWPACNRDKNVLFRNKDSNKVVKTDLILTVKCLSKYIECNPAGNLEGKEDK